MEMLCYGMRNNKLRRYFNIIEPEWPGRKKCCGWEKPFSGIADHYKFYI